MPVTPEDLKALSSDRLSYLADQLVLVGYVLGRLALIEVCIDEGATPTAKAQAGRALTQIGESPQTIVDRLKGSKFADKSPEQLRDYIQKLRDEDMLLDTLSQE